MNNYIYIILFFILSFIILLFLSSKPNNNNETRLKIYEIINKKLSGENMNNHVFKIINKINKMDKKNAEDYNNLGMIYSIFLNNHKKSYENYIKALQNINNSVHNMVHRQMHLTEPDNISFIYQMKNIVNRKKTINNKDKYIYSSNLRQKILPIIDKTQNLIHKKSVEKAHKEKTSIKKNPTKKLIKKKAWKSDSQNVHDSVILHDFKSQFNYIKSQNDIINCPYSSFDQICKIVLNGSKDQNKNTMKVLERLKNNSKVLGLNICEQEYITEIWRRIKSPSNIKNRKELEKSFIASIKDCFENEDVVCSSGRNTRILASLAFLDKDSKKRGIGILKSKEALRNEILEESAKVVQKYLGKNSNTPKYIIDHYNKSKITKKVKELEENIRKDILNLKDKFINRGLEKKNIDQILNECIAVI